MWTTITTTGGCLAPLLLVCAEIGSTYARSPRANADQDDLDAEALERWYCDATGNEYLPFSLTLIDSRPLTNAHAASQGLP